MALKLQACGTSENLYNLLINYLMNMKQYVEIEGQRSNKKEIRYGVAQGSILGPMLFSIYINDLTQVPKRGKL